MSAAQAQPLGEPDDCITKAAAYHGVSSLVLRAIAWNESQMRPSTVARNPNGTRDLGALQTNSVHLAELSRFGIRERDLLDGCVSAYVGAWHLRQHIARYGLTWQAIGAYHSRTPTHNARYANRIFATLQQWGVVPPGPPPFPATSTKPSTDSRATRASAESSSPIVFQASKSS
jgi:soluble lytic murein transglycosylase-like protein